MKPAIAIGLRSQWGNLDLIEITSKDRFYYYGRTSNGQQTRGALCDLRGEYASTDIANAAFKEIQLTKQKHAPIIEDARKALKKAEAERDAAIDAVIEAYSKKGT